MVAGGRASQIWSEGMEERGEGGHVGVLGGVESRRSSPKSAAVGARARERERRAGERGVGQRERGDRDRGGGATAGWGSAVS